MNEQVMQTAATVVTEPGWAFAVLLLVGSAFLLFASLGSIKFPDFFMRMAAISKAGTLGAACLLMAPFAAEPTWDHFAKSSFALVFLFASAPVAAHFLGRSAYLNGIELWKNTRRDDWKGRS